VSQPDVVTLLSTEGSEGSANDDTGNDDDGQQGSSDYVRHVTGERHDDASVISVANSARIDGSSWQLGQIASLLGFGAQCVVAISQKLGNSGDGEAVERWVVATGKTVARVHSARITISAGDVGVSASGGRDARVVGAGVEIVADGGDVDRGVVASRGGIAQVVSAEVAIAAGLSNVNAQSGVGIARVISASVSVVAVDGSLSALSIGGVALVDVAFDRWADNRDGVQAPVALDRVVSATSVDIASVGSARVVVVTVDSGIRATAGGDTGGGGASVDCWANNGGRVVATSDLAWDAVIDGAIVAIAAGLGGVGATSSVDSWVARVNSAFVSVVAD